MEKLEFNVTSRQAFTWFVGLQVLPKLPEAKRGV